MNNYNHNSHKSSTDQTKPTTSSPGCRPLGRQPGDSLLYLYSNNSIEHTTINSQEQIKTEVVNNLCNLLTPYHRRQAHTLHSNVERLINKVAPSINHVAFFTLTFPANVTDSQEAYKRYRSLNTNFLSTWSEFKDWVCVKERQKRGAWHYHLIAVMAQDIRTGVNFEELEKRHYGSAGPYLRNIWKTLRENLPNYGFGRSELLPVKSNAEAMGRYVGKYISKHVGQRDEEDKGVRLISYSKGWQKNSCNFSWNTDGAQDWRRKLSLFAQRIGCTEIYQLTEKLGLGWAYKYAEDIMQVDETMELTGGEMATSGKQFESPIIAKVMTRKAKMENYCKKRLLTHRPKVPRELIKQQQATKGKVIAQSFVDQHIDKIYQPLMCVPF